MRPLMPTPCTETALRTSGRDSRTPSRQPMTRINWSMGIVEMRRS
jgi:hypothetical protein